MEISMAAAVFILLILLRLAVPFGVIAGLCIFLNRLCDKWDREAEEAQAAKAEIVA